MKRQKQKGPNQILVICSYCNKVLNVDEFWERKEGALLEGQEHEISHGICPECLRENFPREYLAIQEDRKMRMRNVFKEGFKDLYGHLTK